MGAARDRELASQKKSEIEGGALDRAAARANAGPGKEGDDPAVVAGEDGGNTSAARDGACSRTACRERRQSEPLPRNQIINPNEFAKKSGSVMAVVCR